MDFLSGAALAAFLTGPIAIGVLFFLGVLFEHGNSRGWAMFAFILFAVSAYFTFHPTLADAAIYGAAYVAAGLIWSFWRYKRHVARRVADAKAQNIASYTERVIRELHPRAMLPTITAWIIIWPISLVGNLAGDAIDMVQTLVSKVFRGIYHRIYDSAVSALTP